MNLGPRKVLTHCCLKPALMQNIEFNRELDSKAAEHVHLYRHDKTVTVT